MSDGAEIDLEVKLKIGGLDSPGVPVPGFPSRNLTTMPEPAAQANPPAQQAEQSRKPFRDHVAEYASPCPSPGQEKDKQQGVER
jgi:hypothetical protein